MEFLLEKVRCPRTGRRFRVEGGCLVTDDGALSYRMVNGIPVLLPEEAKEVAP